MRSVSTTMIRVCELVEEIGQCTSGELAKRFGRCVAPYMDRAVTLGLLRVDLGFRPRRYKIAHGWRQRIARPRAPKPSPRKPATRYNAAPLLTAWNGGTQ